MELIITDLKKRKKKKELKQILSEVTRGTLIFRSHKEIRFLMFSYMLKVIHPIRDKM